MVRWRRRDGSAAAGGGRGIARGGPLALLAGLLLAACGAPSAPAAVSTSGGPTSPASATASDQRTSEPYWVPVASFRGSGSVTTGLFTIDAGALQWRATYHCTGAPLTVVVVREDGKPLSRPLVSAQGCSGVGRGYATDSGRFRLRVTAPAGWDLAVEQQVDVPLIQPPPAALASATLVASARVYPVDAAGEGTAKLYRLRDGSYLIRLESFYTTANTDLEVRLSPLAAPRTTAEIMASPYAEVAPLAATVGSMNVAVPPGVDVARYHSMVIWCQITVNAYAAAAF